MGGNNGGMRAAARRDPDFRGIDPDALGHLIQQVQDAGTAITGWLNAHRPPPGVPAGGYRQAAQAEQWATGQLGMLARRRNYAITHPDRAHGITQPVPPRMRGSVGRRGPGATPGDPGSPGTGGGTGRTGGAGTEGTRRPPRTTPTGAGKELGDYPTRQAAAKAARADVLAFERAAGEHRSVPEEVWRRLIAGADDPDYAEAFYERLGPAGTADLVGAAARAREGRAARLDAIEESLGTGSHHLSISEKWVRELLARADRNGDRAEVVRILAAADLSPRTDEVLARLGLLSRAPAPAPGSGTAQRLNGPAPRPAT